jgi:hypothetical protein
MGELTLHHPAMYKEVYLVHGRLAEPGHGLLAFDTHTLLAILISPSRLSVRCVTNWMVRLWDLSVDELEM